jgi:AcrR family transcriptional regulator
VPKIADEARTARRDQIIAAAAGCFAQAGYHATTMADIAEAAGVSKRTPYLYFPGKEAPRLAFSLGRRTTTVEPRPSRPPIR